MRRNGSVTSCVVIFVVIAFVIIVPVIVVVLVIIIAVIVVTIVIITIIVIRLILILVRIIFIRIIIAFVIITVVRSTHSHTCGFTERALLLRCFVVLVIAPGIEIERLQFIACCGRRRFTTRDRFAALRCCVSNEQRPSATCIQLRGNGCDEYRGYNPFLSRIRNHILREEEDGKIGGKLPIIV